MYSDKYLWVGYGDPEKWKPTCIVIPKEPDHYSNWIDTDKPGVYECGVCGRKSAYKSERCYKDA